MRFPGGRMIAVCLSLLLLAAGLMAPIAEAKPIFTVRRTFTVLFLGGSGYLGFKAWDYHRDANRMYGQYKQATTSDQATTLFRRTSDRDTKSQISIALSGALLVAGLRLMFWGGSDKGEEPAKLDRGIMLGVTGRPDQKSLGVVVRKNF
jgi:hypothetical protein